MTLINKVIKKMAIMGANSTSVFATYQPTTPLILREKEPQGKEASK